MKTKLINCHALTVFTTCLILFTNCGKNKRDANSLNLALITDIRGFDPAFATDIRTGGMMALVYDNLVQFGESTELIPGIAHSWDVNESGQKYTFFLNTTARFHDSTFVTSSDVIASFMRLLSPEIGSPQSWLFNKVKGANKYTNGNAPFVSGLKNINDSTLVIELMEPFAPFIQYLAMPSASIINIKHEATIKEIPSGSGPWIMKNWERDGFISYERNEHYWGVLPKSKKLSFRILSESMARMAEFEAGNLDIVKIPDIELTRWKKKANWTGQVVGKDELSIWYIGMNYIRPPFNDRRVRLAMNLALDRQKIISLLLSGSGTLAEGPVPPQLMSAIQNNPFPFNPEKAIRLLESAGYKNGLKTKLWVAGGSEMFHVLEAFQSYWEAVGITVEIVNSDWNVFKTAVRQGTVDLYYLDWYADYPDAENFLYPLFHSRESMTKRSRYSNPEVDKNIEMIQRLTPGEKRSILIEETHMMIKNDAPWVFLWHGKTHTAVQPWIKGYAPKLIFNAERYLTIHQ